MRGEEDRGRRGEWERNCPPLMINY